MKYKTGYRVLDYDSVTGQLKTLFHPIGKSRTIPRGIWLKAKKKMVREGVSTRYLSGFHVFDDFNRCLKYAGKFGKRDQRVVCIVRYQGNRIKKHSRSGVILADYMMVQPGSLEVLGTLNELLGVYNRE